MATVIIRILLFTIPTVVVPAVLTAVVLGGISRRPDAIQKTFATWFGDADDPITGLGVFFLWWLLIQIMVLPLIYPMPQPVPLSGKFTCIGAGDIPRVIYLLCMYGIVPFLFIRFVVSVMHRIPIRNTALGEIMGSTLGYLIVVILLKLITPVEILIALVLTGLILADKKARQSMLGVESPKAVSFLFTCVFVMALLFMIIVNESSEFYRRTIHDRSKRIFGHSGQGTVIEMIWNLVFFYLIPLLLALQYRHHASLRHPKKSTDHEHEHAKEHGVRDATGDKSMLLGLITGVLLGIFVQLALPEKLRPTTLLYRAEDRLFTGKGMSILPTLRMPRGILPTTRSSMASAPRFPLVLGKMPDLRQNLNRIDKNFTSMGGRTVATASGILPVDKSMRRSVEAVTRQALGNETTRKGILQNVSRLTGVRPQTMQQILDNETARKTILQTASKINEADTQKIVRAVRQVLGNEAAKGTIVQTASKFSGIKPLTLETVSRSVLPRLGASSAFFPSRGRPPIAVPITGISTRRGTMMSAL